MIEPTTLNISSLYSLKHLKTLVRNYKLVCFQVCDDIDECKGPDNGGCTSDSLCHNSVVGRLDDIYLTATQLGSRILICFVFFAVQSRNQMCFAPAQGSYHCGSCKTGFTGDQVKGCKPEISCGNSLTNPCDVNAQCIPERDGSITCQVALFIFTQNSLVFAFVLFFPCIQSWEVSFFFSVWNRLGWKWIPLWQGHGH